jgi:uncharacterized protein YqeY
VSATKLKERLRGDLKAAMKSRLNGEAALLRALIAALDNAEAVTGDGIQDNTQPRAFGDPSGEVARLTLDDAAVDALLGHEIDTRLSAAMDYERHGRTDEADRLRAEVGLIGRYRDS